MPAAHAQEPALAGSGPNWQRFFTRRVFLALGLQILLLSLGCRQAPPDASLPENAIARVGDQIISVQALEQELARRSRLSSGTLPDTNQVRTVLEDLIRFEVLYAQARRVGFAESPEMQSAIKRLVVAEYRERLAATNPSSPTQVSPTEIEQYYHAHTNLFQLPEQVQAALIFLPLSPKATPEKQAEARQRAEAIRAQALAGAAFSALAQTNSGHQPTRYRGGDLGWMTREGASRDWEPVLVNALFALQEPGQISPAIQGKDGLYLFRCTARKPASLRPLAEVKEAIAYELLRQQARERDAKLYAQFKADVPVRIQDKALARFLTNLPPAQIPPSVPSQ